MSNTCSQQCPFSIRYLLHLSMLRGGDKVSSELDSLGSSQNPRSPNKKCISAERKETAESHGNKNKQLNIVTGEDLEGGLKVFDLTSSKSKSKNNENVSDKDREARSDKVMNPPSQPKRKSRASILLPFFDDLESPVASPSPGMKGPRSQSRRMTLSPATTRSLMMEVIGDEGVIPCPFECPTPLPLTFSVYSEGIDIIPPRTGREAAEGPCTGPFQRSMPTQEQICRLNSPAGKAAVIELGHQQTGFGNRGLDSVCVPSFGSIGDTAVALPVEQAAVRRQDSSRALSERTSATREDRRGTSPTAECAVKTVPLTMIAEGDKMEEASSVQTNTAVNPCVDLTELSSLPLCTTATARTNSTYCDELDALLDSESDDNSSTTSSTMPYSPSLSTSISSERSPSGSSSSPICLDHSCSPSSGSFSDFCTSTASTDAPYMNQEYPKLPQKTGGNRFPLEGSLDFIFSSSGAEDCSEVVMDDSEEELGRLNNSIAVRNKSTKKGKKREYEDQEPLSPRDTVVPWKCSPNQAILLEHSDRIVVPKDLCGSPIVMEVDPDLGFREGSSSTEEEHSEAKGMFKKSKVESSGEVTSFSPTSSPSKGPQDLDQDQERERAKGRDRERGTVQTGSKAHISTTERINTEELCTSDVRAVACDSVGHHMVMEGSSCTVAARTGPSATTLKEAEMRARSRLGIRQEVAKWKYHWEVASYCAAQTAREARREE